jgi:TIMELESS-interacting protein
MEKTNAAPTGCYKCGRPGHWSRDCPDSNPNPNPNPSSNPNSPRSFPSNNNSSSNNSNYFSGSNSKPAKAAEKPKKVPRSRPKLTPELLLGEDNGLGFILRHFPRNFKYRGRGHEVPSSILAILINFKQASIKYFIFIFATLFL